MADFGAPFRRRGGKKGGFRPRDGGLIEIERRAGQTTRGVERMTRLVDLDGSQFFQGLQVGENRPPGWKVSSRLGEAR